PPPPSSRDHPPDRLSPPALPGLLPAGAERDIETFGAALVELQTLVGRCFAPAQGGLFARPELDDLVEVLRAEGLLGVGQSSWGPALYAFSRAAPDRRSRLLGGLRERLGLRPCPCLWTP